MKNKFNPEREKLINKVGDVDFELGFYGVNWIGEYLCVVVSKDNIQTNLTHYNADGSMAGNLHDFNDKKDYTWEYIPNDVDRKKVYVQLMGYDKEIEDFVSNVCDSFDLDECLGNNFCTYMEYDIENNITNATFYNVPDILQELIGEHVKIDTNRYDLNKVYDYIESHFKDNRCSLSIDRQNSNVIINRNN